MNTIPPPPQFVKLDPTTKRITYSYLLDPLDSGEWRVRVVCKADEICYTWFEGYGASDWAALRLACNHMLEVVRNGN